MMGSNTVSLSWAQGEISWRDSIIANLEAELEEIRIDRATMHNPVQDDDKAAPPAAEPDGDVRAAAERCEFIMLPNASNDWEHAATELVEDLATLARAYLALRTAGGVPVDDGEAVTEEWLRSVGFTQIDEGAFAIDIWRARTCSMDGPDECGTSLVWSCNECWILDLYDIDKRGKGGWAGVNTRRELRRLCSALGITLPAPTDVKEPRHAD